MFFCSSSADTLSGVEFQLPYGEGSSLADIFGHLEHHRYKMASEFPCIESWLSLAKPVGFITQGETWNRRIQHQSINIGDHI